MLKLTQFQENTIKEIFTNINQGNLHISLAMPTGSGKSTLLLYIAQKLLQQGKSVLVIVDTFILKEYFEAKFSELSLDNYVIKTASRYSKEKFSLDDYDTLLLDNLRPHQRYKIRNADVDFSTKIIVSFITPGQELKGEEQYMSKNIQFIDDSSLTREIPESITPYIIPTGNILDIRDSFLASREQKEKLAQILGKCIENEYYIDKHEEKPQLNIKQLYCRHNIKESKKSHVSRTPLTKLLLQSIASLSSTVNNIGIVDSAITTEILRPYKLSIKIVKYFLDTLKTSNEPKNNLFTHEHYTEVLKGFLSVNVWEKLSQESRNFLISGMISYEISKNEAVKHDFSGVCVSISKSLDVEITKRVYEQYIEYLKHKYNDYDKWPQALIANGNILNPEKFTLGTVIYVIGKGKHEILNNTDYQNFLNYALEVLYNRGLTLSDIIDNISILCDCVENVRLKYRNVAAHREPVDYRTAKECIEYLITDQQMLKEILKDMVS